MCRTVFRMLLMLVSYCYDKVHAGQRTWQDSQTGFLLPDGQYEEFYCNCWYYTPRCINVCKNYITRHGTTGRSPRPVHIRAPAFNPNTVHYQGPGAMPGDYTAGTAYQADVYPGYFPMQHLSIETIISSERIGKRTLSAQGPRNVVKKIPQPVEIEAGPAQMSSSLLMLPVFSDKIRKNTNVESDRRMCEFLVWIHQAGTNSTDRRQRALLKEILGHFFRTNNLTEIVCEAKGSLSSKRNGAYESLYTITKVPHVDVFPPSTSVHVVPPNIALGVSMESGSSRVLYSKIYYTTTITPITTIFTSLDDHDTEKNACETSASKRTSPVSTMSKADIKQDALIVAGKVHERRGKIEKIISSAHKEGKLVDRAGSGADTRLKYRTIFVWKTFTPYITKEVLKYPKTAYYTTTELFTITPLTTVYVDDENIGAGREDHSMYMGSGFANGYGAAPGDAGRGNSGMRAGPSFAPPDEINNFHEKKPLATQEEISHVLTHHNKDSDINSQETPRESNRPERKEAQDSIDTSGGTEKHKSGERSVSSVIVHSTDVLKDVSDKHIQIQESSIRKKDILPLSSVDTKSMLEPVSVQSVQPLHTVSSSALPSTVKFTQNESAHSSLLKTQYWVRYASREVALTTDRERLQNATEGMSTTTVLTTTTVILDLERILEGQVKGIIQRKNVLFKEKEQTTDSSHEDNAHVSKGHGDGNKNSVEREKREDKEHLEQQGINVAEYGRHSDSGKDARTDTVLPAIQSLDNIEADKESAAYTSILQVSNASPSAENMVQSVEVTHRNSTGVDANAEPSVQRNSTCKKAVTKVFTILTERESHSSGVAGLTTSYIVTKNNNRDIAYAQASRSLLNIQKEPDSQTREHISHRTHLMDIPLVSAIVHEINAANMFRTVSVITTTKTDCAEDKVVSVRKTPPVVDLNTKIQEQRFHSDCTSLTIPNKQAVQSATDKDDKNTLLTIRSMVSSSMMSTESIAKEMLYDNGSVIDTVPKSGIRTRLRSDAPVNPKSETEVNSSNSHLSLLGTQYLSGDAVSKTVSAFPIVKRVDIDDNFGVEIKVGPV